MSAFDDMAAEAQWTREDALRGTTRSPLSCGDIGHDGLSLEPACDLQLGHGGNMHSGGDPRVWWTRDGAMVDFAVASSQEAPKAWSENDKN